MWFSMMADIDSSIISFFTQLTTVIGFGGYLGIALGVEVFFILLYLLKSAFSYEARLKRCIDKYNNWLFINKKIDKDNIKDFNNLIRKGPKRFVYFWQQFILFREKGPTYYLSEENLIDKPLKTSSWANNIRNFNIFTIVWAIISLLFGFASQAGKAFSLNLFAVSFVIPVLVLFIGAVTTVILKAKRVLNLDDLYHNYHIFQRFITNACMDLPVYIDYDLLFTQKEISRGNPQLREFYENRARKAKEEFENAKQNEIEYVEYNFEKAGIDGSLVLDRAMRETEAYLNKKQIILTKITDIDMQKEALRRNYENTQKDLQKKIQAAKENIAKLLQQQEATTSRMEVSFLRKQQDQERAKQEQLQSEYDQEETRYAISNDELKKELEELHAQLDESKVNVEKAMLAEYQSFYEKVLKVSIDRAENKVKKEMADYREKAEESDKQLTIVQTQIKRLADENEILREKLGQANGEENVQIQGKYDENGNYVYEDGSFHDVNGYFHDVEGNVYDVNGNLIEQKKPETNDHYDKFGMPFENVEENANQNEEDVQEEEPSIAMQFGETAEKLNQEELENETKVDQEIVADQEQSTEATQEKRKRGRPRKVVEENLEPKEPKKRGRPKKDSSEQTEKVEKTKTTPKRSPYKKKTTSKKSSSKTQKTNKEGQPSLAQISKMISEEEEKLSKMKAFINSEIDDTINVGSDNLDKEKDEIMKTVEDLKEKAENAKQTDKSESELASINKRLEELIKEISNLNNKNN